MISKSNMHINFKRLPILFCKRATAQGFTIIEVLIAIFLLTVAILAIISTTDLLMRENAFDKMATTATTLAKDKIESLKNKSYVNYTDTDLSAGEHTDTVTMNSTVYTRKWTIMDDSPAANMKTIKVEVSWSWKTMTKDVSLNTIVGKEL